MPADRAPGFTLIELIAVLVVLGLLLTFSPMAIDWLVAEKELESEVSRLGNWIQILKDQAVLDQARYAIHYDTEKHRYAIQVPDEVTQETEDPDADPQTSLVLEDDMHELDLDWHRLPSDFTLELFEGRRPIQDGRYRVLFEPGGTVPPHTLVIKSDRISSLDDRETTRTIKVNFPGFVSYAPGRVVEEFKKSASELGR